MGREYQGAGGLRLHLDEPLSPQMEEQVRKGHLVPVEADTPVAEPVEDGTPQEPAGDGEPKRPTANSKVDDWRAYALSLGMPEDEAAGATKAELQGWVEVAEGSGE
ncbi:hypothetical protein [Streptomyces sp. NPDC056105]|uniref:hypothetical protein n=1 Tax=Streptomyces sp. NPDC056105 TaxID=3345714 RepID=UPI0035E1BFAF